MGFLSNSLYSKTILFKNDTIGGGTFFVDDHPTCLSHLTREGYIHEHCSRVAGFNTNHLYEGRCRFHTSDREHLNIKSGRYAHVTSHQLNLNLQRVQEDPDIFNMTPELELLRSLLLTHVEKTSMDMTEGNIRTTRELVREVTNLIDKIQTIQERHVLTVSAARLMMLRAIEIAKDYVPSERLKSFVQDWKQNTLPVSHTPTFEEEIVEVPVSIEKVKIFKQKR